VGGILPTCLSGEGERGSTLPTSDQPERAAQQLRGASLGTRPETGNRYHPSTERIPAGAGSPENAGLQRPASAALGAPAGGNPAPEQPPHSGRCPSGRAATGEHTALAPPLAAAGAARGTLGTVVLRPGAALAGRGWPSRACGGAGEPPFCEKQRRPLPVSGRVGRGAPTPFYFASRFLILLLLYLSLSSPPLPSPVGSPSSLCFCCPSVPAPAGTAEPET